MKLITLLFVLATGSIASADIDGTYWCSDNGTLTVTYIQDRTYYANLEYPNGSASILEKFTFPISENAPQPAIDANWHPMVGEMTSDDSDSYDLGHVVIGNAKLTLYFYDSTLTCTLKDN